MLLPRALPRLLATALLLPRSAATTSAVRHGGSDRWHTLSVAALLPRRRVPFARGFVSTSSTAAPDAKPRNGGGAARVLIFDDDCEPTIHALSRAEVLRITQDAAIPDVDDATPLRRESLPPSGAPFGVARRGGASGSAKRSNFESIVDVQRVHARDIRQLDSAFALRSEPSVEVRDQAILVNTDPIRAIIMRHRCLVFLREDDQTLQPMLEDVFHEVASHDDGNDAVTYEFMALEALLGALCRYYHDDFDRVAPAIATSLNRLTSGQPTTGELNTLRAFKNTMNEFHSRVDGVRRALMATLNNEEDLRLLYLSKLHKDRTLLGNIWSFDSEEAEVLIENYLQDIYALQTNATLLQQRIQNTETVVKMRLDAMRNYLLGVNIMFSVAGISLSTGTFTVGIFGMNLVSGLEEAPGWFAGVSALSAMLMATTGVTAMRFFRRKGIFSAVPNVNSVTDSPVAATAVSLGAKAAADKAAKIPSGSSIKPATMPAPTPTPMPGATDTDTDATVSPSPKSSI